MLKLVAIYLGDDLISISSASVEEIEQNFRDKRGDISRMYLIEPGDEKISFYSFTIDGECTAEELCKFIKELGYFIFFDEVEENFSFSLSTPLKEKIGGLLLRKGHMSKEELYRIFSAVNPPKDSSVFYKRIMKDFVEEGYTLQHNSIGGIYIKSLKRDKELLFFNSSSTN